MYLSINFNLNIWRIIANCSWSGWSECKQKECGNEKKEGVRSRILESLDEIDQEIQCMGNSQEDCDNVQLYCNGWKINFVYYMLNLY